MSRFPDPREEARTYLESKGVLDLFQELGTLLMYHKPADPRTFLIEQLQILQEKQKVEVLGSSIFTDSDIKTLFGMFDPTGKGTIDANQCKQGKFSIVSLIKLLVNKVFEVIDLFQIMSIL
jgi:hypothetical protein